MNSEKKRFNPRLQLAFAVLLLGAGTLLLGAGRIGDSLASRQAEKDKAQDEWRTAANSLLVSDSSAQDKELRKLAASNPELLLKAFHRELSPEQEP